jgi:hypothetical protein
MSPLQLSVQLIDGRVLLADACCDYSTGMALHNRGRPITVILLGYVLPLDVLTSYTDGTSMVTQCPIVPGSE